MTPEITAILITAVVGLFNLLVGAMLGFLFSVAGTYLAHRFQLKRDRQTRAWQLEDKKQELGLSVLAGNLGRARQFADLYLDAANRIVAYQLQLIAARDPDVARPFFVEIAPVLKRITGEQVGILSTKDTPLQTCADAMIGLYIAENEQAVSLADRVTKADIDPKAETRRISAFLTQMGKLRAQLHKRIDELAVLPLV